jgi:hypothetical protein
MCARRTERCRHFGWRAIEQAHVVSTPKALRAALPDLTFRCRHGWQYDRIFGWQPGPLTPMFPRQPPAGVLHRKGTAAADRGLEPIPGWRGSYLVEPLTVTPLPGCGFWVGTTLRSVLPLLSHARRSRAGSAAAQRTASSCSARKVRPKSLAGSSAIAPTA